MKVAILSYPMLFQNPGGLQIQVLETITALNNLGVEAKLIDPNKDKLNDFDIIHIFSAINGNHRIAEHATAIGKPVVTSPLIQPHWNRRSGQRARILERIVGRLTRWEVKTEYRQISSCLEKSDYLIALGSIEKNSIESAFRLASDKVEIIPNGIPERFFKSTPELFIKKTGINTDFALCAGSINPHKNQLTLAKTTKELGLPLVLIGSCLPTEKQYLESLIKYPHVHYIGSLDYKDPLLASAYAAAKVFCLPSFSEVMPLCTLESLAAGTAVIMTKHHGMDMNGLENVITEISPQDIVSIKKAITSILQETPDKQTCSSSVKDLTWQNAANRIKNIYTKLLN